METYRCREHSSSAISTACVQTRSALRCVNQLRSVFPHSSPKCNFLWEPEASHGRLVLLGGHRQLLRCGALEELLGKQALTLLDSWHGQDVQTHAAWCELHSRLTSVFWSVTGCTWPAFPANPLDGGSNRRWPLSSTCWTSCCHHEVNDVAPRELLLAALSCVKLA